jgi:DNA-binding GntR family transcriptional regulator
MNRGVTVTELTATELAEIYRVRLLLEIASVQSANPVSADSAASMEKALRGYERAVMEKDWIRAVECDFRFHGLLVRLLGSTRINVFFQKVLAELRLCMLLVDQNHGALVRVAADHRRIYELLVADKRGECARVLEAHLSDSASRVQEMIEDMMTMKAVR